MGTALWGLCKSVADSFWSWHREVQRRASRLALGQRKGEMPYDGRPSLSDRRSSLSDRRLNLFSFIECFKIVFDSNNEQWELKLSTRPQASHSVIIIDARIYWCALLIDCIENQSWPSNRSTVKSWHYLMVWTSIERVNCYIWITHLVL